MATGMLTESQLKEKLATPRSPPPIPQEPFTLTKPFIDTPFPYPDCARPLTKKTPNGRGRALPKYRRRTWASATSR